VCVAPSNRDIVWVGTGENNPRNSVSFGDGVYKSVDGGKTWKNVGLKKSFQIGKIAIHPKNPDIVYVGALGRLYGANEERGIYKTIDGGKNFKRLTAGLPACQLGRVGLDYYRKDPRIVFAVVDCQKIGMGLPPPRVYLGVEGEAAPAGVKLTKVQPDSPAAKA